MCVVQGRHKHGLVHCNLRPLTSSNGFRLLSIAGVLPAHPHIPLVRSARWETDQIRQRYGLAKDVELADDTHELSASINKDQRKVPRSLRKY